MLLWSGARSHVHPNQSAEQVQDCLLLISLVQWELFSTRGKHAPVFPLSQKMWLWPIDLHGIHFSLLTCRRIIKYNPIWLFLLLSVAVITRENSRILYTKHNNVLQLVQQDQKTTQSWFRCLPTPTKMPSHGRYTLFFKWWQVERSNPVI